MAQLIVKDLDFCEIELSEVEGGWIEIQVDAASALEVEGNSAGAGLAGAAAVAVGGEQPFAGVLALVGIS